MLEFLKFDTVASAIGLVATVFGWLPISRWVGKLRARYRFWGISAPKGSDIRVIMGRVAETPHPRGYNYTTVSAGDAEASAHIVSALAFAYGAKYKLSSRPTNAFHRDFWDDPVILVGGQTRNDQTRRFIEALNDSGSLPYEICDLSQDKRYFVNRATGEKRVADIRPSGRSDGGPASGSIDYALIVRARNPWSRDRTTDDGFLFYGLHAFGTVAAASMLNPSSFKNFVAQIREKWVRQQPAWRRRVPFAREKFPEHFAILLCVRIDDDHSRVDVAEVLKVEPDEALAAQRIVHRQAQISREPALPPQPLPGETANGDRQAVQ